MWVFTVDNLCWRTSVIYIWAASRQNQHKCVCDQHGSRPACKDPCCSLSVSLLVIELVSEQHGSWSDSAAHIYCTQPGQPKHPGILARLYTACTSIIVLRYWNALTFNRTVPNTKQGNFITQFSKFKGLVVTLLHLINQILLKLYIFTSSLWLTSFSKYWPVFVGQTCLEFK
jgi:hypothetical protein